MYDRTSRSRKEWLNTGEIQRALKELGFPIDTYKAPNASITTTVNRLVDDGYVVSDKRLGAGAIEYKWVGKALSLDPYTTAGQAVISQRMSEGKPFTNSELRDLTKAKKK